MSFAREPEVRLSLTDDLIDCSTELTAIKDIKAGLRKNAAEISAEQAKEDNMREQLAERPSLLEEVRRIDTILTDARITKQRLWYSEQKVFNDTQQHVDQLNDRVANVTAPLDLAPLWPDDTSAYPSQDLLEKVKNTYEDWQRYLGDMRNGVRIKLDSLAENLGRLREEWSERFDKAEAEYRHLLAQLDENGVGLQALSERRKNMQQRISTLDDLDQTLLKDIRPRIEGLKTVRGELLNKLQDNRKVITSKREQKAKELSTKLNHKIRLQVHARANVANFQGALQEISQGSYLHASDVDSLVSKCHPVSLVKRLLTGDLDSIATQSGLQTSKLAKMWDTILDRNRQADLYELQLTDIEDVIEVQLEVGQGNYRRLEDLSHGQKCMVVLMVALAEGDFPLLVDQPEDALHAPSIEEGIVINPKVRKGHQAIYLCYSQREYIGISRRRADNCSTGRCQEWPSCWKRFPRPV